MNRPVSATELQALSDAPRDEHADAPEDLKESGLSQRDALLSITDDIRLWRTPDGDTFASVNHAGHVEHHAVASRGFRDWLLSEYANRFTVNGRAASCGENVVRDVRAHLEARAFADGLRHDAAMRTVEHDGAVYIDRGTDDWSAIEVSAKGWRTVAAAPAPIIRTRRTAALAEPAAKPDFTRWWELLSGLEEADKILLTAWCLGALWPSGPYPVLVLGGEQGSGKSTIARIAQRLSDPVTGDLLQPPGDDRDLIAAARHGQVLAFDNISSVKADLADSICRLSTGAEIGGRALFTNHDSATFRASRPIILNGIPDLCARGDLADRSIVIKLAPIERRTTERDFRRDVEAALPGALTGLLDALVVGLRELDTTPTPSVRMADFARLIAAAEPALPWRKGAFLEAYSANRGRVVSTIVEGDIVATRVRAFVVDQGGNWSGLMSDLLALLSETELPEGGRSSEWPANARWFSNGLTRAAPALRGIGIDVQTKHVKDGTRVDIREIASLASPASPAADQKVTR